MSFGQEIADAAAEILGPGDDTLGEQFVMSRSGGGYDATTRKKTAGAAVTQTLWGTLDSELVPASISQGLASTHDRVLYAVPTTGGYEPAQADRLAAEGRVWQVEKTAHVIKQSVPILWICGLKQA